MNLRMLRGSIAQRPVRAFTVTKRQDNPSMSSILLSLAVTVEQHDGGEFYWVILESFDRSMVFDSLMESAHGFATYSAALDAGAEALKGISENPEQGPREEVDGNEDWE